MWHLHRVTMTAFRSRNTKDQVKKHTRSSCSSVSTSTVPTKLVLGFEPLPLEKKNSSNLHSNMSTSYQQHQFTKAKKSTNENWKVIIIRHWCRRCRTVANEFHLAFPHRVLPFYFSCLVHHNLNLVTCIVWQTSVTGQLITCCWCSKDFISCEHPLINPRHNSSIKKMLVASRWSKWWWEAPGERWIFRRLRMQLMYMYVPNF